MHTTGRERSSFRHGPWAPQRHYWHRATCVSGSAGRDGELKGNPVQYLRQAWTGHWKLRQERTHGSVRCGWAVGRGCVSWPARGCAFTRPVCLRRCQSSTTSDPRKSSNSNALISTQTSRVREKCRGVIFRSAFVKCSLIGERAETSIL